ncbi:MAG TPA: (2Fe-2S)-binding protein [Polyangia bacterium]|nr:(2Fe-2S)-binding protein [Polyangia bacterium]
MANQKDDDQKKGGLTRRELFRSLGGGALVGGLVPAGALFRTLAPPPAGVQVLGPGKVTITLRVNGTDKKLEVEPRTTLLTALREDLDLTGSKLVCDRGSCGACTVHLDGQPVCACMLLAVDAQGRAITTIEGLARGEELAPIQQAFVDYDALQCGFCTPGMIMSCAALLLHNASPTLDDVKHAVAGNLCRCGTYPKVFEATLAAAKKGGHARG